jgi:hypothetical protein
VVCACNPSYKGGGDWEDSSLKAKSYQDPMPVVPAMQEAEVGRSWSEATKPHPKNN